MLVSSQPSGLQSFFRTPPPVQRPHQFLLKIASASPYRPLPYFATRPTTPPSPTPSKASPNTALLVDGLLENSDLRGQRSFNLRKPDDPMAFTLMDEKTGKVRRPSAEETDAIRSHFPACTGYRMSTPYLILECSTPPVVAPITVGGLPTIYTTSMDKYVETWGKLGNPMVKDFGPKEFEVVDLHFPKFEMVCKALKLFRQNLVNIVGLRWYLTYWVAEVVGEIDLVILPGKFANRPVRYTQCQTSSQSRLRLQTPLPGQPEHHDNTDYRAFGLSPGVKVCGQHMSTSAGVLVQHNDGRRRITLANHGFYDTDAVYHPDLLASFRLGTIFERFYQADIALCQFENSISFTNRSYFDANPPRTLVTSQHLESIVDMWSWFELDGMTTGRVSMLYSGPGARFLDIPEELRETTTFDYHLEYNFDFFGPGSKAVKAGVCGSPIVHQHEAGSERDGIVAGFYFLDDGVHAIVPTLDRFLASGWQLAAE